LLTQTRPKQQAQAVTKPHKTPFFPRYQDEYIAKNSQLAKAMVRVVSMLLCYTTGWHPPHPTTTTKHQSQMTAKH
jgi:hypothetical protein